MIASPATWANRYRDPVFDFPTSEVARRAATFLNDRFSKFCASYKRIDDRLWRVEVVGVPLPEAIKALSAGGFIGECYSPY